MPSASAQAAAQAAFCALCRPRKRADAADRRDLAARAAGGAPDDFALDIDAVGQRVLHRHPHHAPAGLLDAVGSVAGKAVVDADDRGALLLHARDEPLLHRGVMF